VAQDEQHGVILRSDTVAPPHSLREERHQLRQTDPEGPPFGASEPRLGRAAGKRTRAESAFVGPITLSFPFLIFLVFLLFYSLFFLIFEFKFESQICGEFVLI
jgi:hypothetical protein